MGELDEWIRYWRKTFAKCFKMHKDSRVHRHAYAELSELLNKVEVSAEAKELEATALWAVKFMQRLHELESDIGHLAPDRKIPMPPARNDGDGPPGNDERTGR